MAIITMALSFVFFPFEMSCALFHYLSGSRLFQGSILLHVLSLPFAIVALCTTHWVEVLVRNHESSSGNFSTWEVSVGLWTPHGSSTHWCDIPPIIKILEGPRCGDFVQFTVFTAAVLVMAVIFDAVNVLVALYARKVTFPIALLSAGLYVASVLIFSTAATPSLRQSARSPSFHTIEVTLSWSFGLSVVSAVSNVGGLLLVTSSCDSVIEESLGFAGHKKQMADISQYNKRMERYFNSIVSEGGMNIAETTAGPMPP